MLAWRTGKKVAGVEGFEPPNGGIKTRCLTAWRHPSDVYRAIAALFEFAVVGAHGPVIG